MGKKKSEKDPVDDKIQAIDETQKKVMEKFNIRGIWIEREKCYKVLISRYSFYIKVLDFTENPYVVYGVDIYGKAVSIDFRKAFMISEYDCNQFEQRKNKAKEKA
jgi:hypothetical protein